jgi:hypothetical protein
MLVLDNTKKSQLVTCDRKYYWQFERHLKPTQGSTALRYGIVWHTGKEGFYGYIKEHGWTHDGKAIEAAIVAAKKEWDDLSSKQTFLEDYRTLENYMQALIAYVAHFNHDEGILKINHVERKFKINMKLRIDSSREELLFPLVAAEEVLFAGRLDADIELDSRPWQMEQKTTGQSLSVQRNRLRRNPQNIGYAYADQRLGGESEGCLVVLHHLSAYKSKTTGLYGKAKVDFDRIPQIYTEGDLEAWRQSFLYNAERILNNREKGIWPMQQDNCYQYGRCTYTGLCEQNAPLGEEILEGFFEDEPWDPAPDVEITE